MQDEIQNESRKNSREMWLFLIFLDLVATCVFGFFIYKSFFALPSSQDSKKEEAFLDDVVVEDIAPAQEEVVLPAAPVEVKEEPKAEVKEEAKPEVKTEAKAEVKKEEPKKEEAKPAAKKQRSVFVSGSGKTRKITFKYFGSARKVAVVGGFTMSKPVAMKKRGNEWSVSVVVFPGTYNYLYIVDGKTMADPNGRMDGSKSVFTAR